jgi:hypothetical protein
MAILGIFEFRSAYVSYATALFGLLLGQPLVAEIVAIGIGHLIWYIADVLPHIIGLRLLQPGTWVPGVVGFVHRRIAPPRNGPAPE